MAGGVGAGGTADSARRAVYRGKTQGPGSCRQPDRSSNLIHASNRSRRTTEGKRLLVTLKQSPAALLDFM